MDTKKFEVRRNLSMYSEKKFAEKLFKNGFIPYYPFKDIGIDIIATTKKGEIYKFQLKARSFNTYKEYWFSVRIKDLKKYLKEKNMFYVFCALLPNNQFDFFIIPINVVLYYVKEKKKNVKDKEIYFFEIKPIDKNKYEVRPKRIKISINDFLWDKFARGIK